MRRGANGIERQREPGRHAIVGVQAACRGGGVFRQLYTVAKRHRLCVFGWHVAAGRLYVLE